MKLYFPEITFQAAHYIPEHPKCHVIHGHTYFVRNLTIEPDYSQNSWDEIIHANNGMLVDFGKIKNYFKEQWDHKFIVPKNEMTGHAWLGTFTENLVELKYTTAEWMAREIKLGIYKLITEFDPEIHFELWEGPNQAVIV